MKNNWYLKDLKEETQEVSDKIANEILPYPNDKDLVEIFNLIENPNGDSEAIGKAATNGIKDIPNMEKDANSSSLIRCVIPCCHVL